MPADLASFVRALPKVELHLHLLGSASPETVVELAARHPDSPVPTDLDRLRDYYEFRDFPHFIDVYKSVAALVRDGDDIRTLIVGLARDLSTHTVRYAEVMVCPYTIDLIRRAQPDGLVGFSLAGNEEGVDRAGRAPHPDRGVPYLQCAHACGG